MSIEQVVDDGIGRLFEAVLERLESGVHVSADRARVHQKYAREGRDAEDHSGGED
jgi:hypothetical protein